MAPSTAWKRIDTTQVRAFYRRAYTATNAQIVIVGDLSREQAQVLSQTLADALPSGPALPVSGALVASTNTGTTLHLQESTTQTLLMMGHNSLPDHHPDALAVRISNVIFNQILNKQLRELHSVTYGVLSGYQSRQGPNPLGDSSFPATPLQPGDHSADQSPVCPIHQRGA